MKLWFPLTLVCCLLLCLSMLLSLTRAVLNQPRQTVGLGPPPTSLLVRCMEFDPARVGSVVLDRALSAGNISPPGGKTHGSPEPMGRGRVADQAGNSNHRHRATFSTKLLAFNRRIEEPGFCNSL